MLLCYRNGNASMLSGGMLLCDRWAATPSLRPTTCGPSSAAPRWRRPRRSPPRWTRSPRSPRSPRAARALPSPLQLSCPAGLEQPVRKYSLRQCALPGGTGAVALSCDRARGVGRDREGVSHFTRLKLYITHRRAARLLGTTATVYVPGTARPHWSRDCGLTNRCYGGVYALSRARATRVSDSVTPTRPM